jgi:hypothetical protein
MSILGYSAPVTKISTLPVVLSRGWCAVQEANKAVRIGGRTCETHWVDHPRVMPDSNVWRAIVDANAVEDLRSTARQFGVQIVACPAVVFEAMRGGDPRLRKELVKAMTRGSWLRLMPEAYKEAAEVRNEIARLHPDWINPKPNLSAWQRNKADWESAWWRRVRQDTRAEAARIHTLGADRLEQARVEARILRSQASDEKRTFDNLSLDLQVSLEVGTEGWDGLPFDAWRYGGLNRWLSAIANPDSTDGQWLGPWLNAKTIWENLPDWVSMWTVEVDKSGLPSEWLRWAFEYVQATRKTSDGTPVDNQIATYLPECDLFVSADKVFVQCVEKIRALSPVKLARALQIPAGEEGVASFLNTVRELKNAS